MGIYIKGMKMPKNCFVCKFKNLFICEGGCPLIKVPPHGDLIDRDTLLASENQHYDIHSDSYYVEVRTIELAQTIIEAGGE